MIDYSLFSHSKKTYSGANGAKRSIMINGEKWMIKFPTKATLNENLSYANSAYSEYIGCHIFNEIGILAQETMIGLYGEKIVVACKDFATERELNDFASLKNQIIDTNRNGYGTELEEILMSIEEQSLIEKNVLKNYFWDMFIVDALIGNWDRHNGNWGFLYDEKTDCMEKAPIFDCGSSLYPQADNIMMEKILNDQNEMNARIYNRPTSAIQMNKHRINYFDFLASLNNEDCNEALKRIMPKIQMDQIYEIINTAPGITDLQSRFYKQILKERKERILDYAYNKLLQRESGNRL